MSCDYIEARVLLFMHGDLSVWRHASNHYIYYDVGSTCQIIRKDQISQEEASLASQGMESALKVLGEIRNRLERAGVNAYASNLPPDAPEWKDARQFMQL